MGEAHYQVFGPATSGERPPVTCGRIVKVNIAREVDKQPQTDRWRPAIVVEVWGDSANPSSINAVAFLDGLNDRPYGGWVPTPSDSSSVLTAWVTSAVHGFGPQEWCWPDELDEHLAELAAQAPAVQDAP